MCPKRAATCSDQRCLLGGWGALGWLDDGQLPSGCSVVVCVLLIGIAHVALHLHDFKAVCCRGVAGEGCVLYHYWVILVGGTLVRNCWVVFKVVQGV
ncbi:hypothetical protein V8C86DRAFT_2518675 [Haematococcus lacustris]